VSIEIHANNFIAITETLLSGVMMPLKVQTETRVGVFARYSAPASAPRANSATAPKAQPIRDACEQEIERALNEALARDEVAAIITGLSASGCDAIRLLSCLLAARFHQGVGRYADAFLEFLIDHDENLAFEVNNFTECRATIYRANIEPLRFACLDGYKDALHDLGRAIPRGQRFGL
jgi:hypothetical protein